MISEERLRGIEETWRLTTAGHATPPAHVAREQVSELIAEIRRLQQVPSVSEANRIIAEIREQAREEFAAEIRELRAQLERERT